MMVTRSPLIPHAIGPYRLSLSGGLQDYNRCLRRTDAFAR